MKEFQARNGQYRIKPIWCWIIISQQIGVNIQFPLNFIIYYKLNAVVKVRGERIKIIIKQLEYFGFAKHTYNTRVLCYEIRQIGVSL